MGDDLTLSDFLDANTTTALIGEPANIMDTVNIGSAFQDLSAADLATPATGIVAQPSLSSVINAPQYPQDPNVDSGGQTMAPSAGLSVGSPSMLNTALPAAAAVTVGAIASSEDGNSGPWPRIGTGAQTTATTADSSAAQAATVTSDTGSITINPQVVGSLGAITGALVAALGGANVKTVQGPVGSGLTTQVASIGGVAPVAGGTGLALVTAPSPVSQALAPLSAIFSGSNSSGLLILCGLGLLLFSGSK